MATGNVPTRSGTGSYDAVEAHTQEDGASIVAHIDALIEKVTDPALRQALREQVETMLNKQSFGLVYQPHKPETVELPNYKVRRGCKVRIRAAEDGHLHQVLRVADGMASVAALNEAGETLDLAVDELVVVREFGEAIYPGLRSLGRVERGGDKPAHIVINAENFHGLETLLYTHEEKLDVIYIDPPYNSGARDWKYNNDYVDGVDVYRHSKWLAFIERRLRIARRLLKPDRSVLIVTIDEKEYLHLGMLLEQTFRDSNLQMVSSIINPAGSARKGEFSRTNEYIFIVYFGDAAPRALELGQEWFGKTSSKRKNKLRWQELSRRGDNGRRSARPNLFYPIFVASDGTKVESVGEAIAEGADRTTVKAPKGTVAIWPIRSDGSDGTWGRNPTSLREALTNGYVRLGGFTPRGMAIYHMARGEQQKVESGVFQVTAHRQDGSVIVDDADYRQANIPGTQWDIPAHDASTFGSALLRRFVPDRRFPFPKSLYAVGDVLRFFVSDKPDAVVLDFFAGSGTTAHAVGLLNAEDGGRRRAILVTNNEVSDDEARRMRVSGLFPGDPDWESLGIFNHITKPRLEAAISGVAHNGDAIEGTYLGGTAYGDGLAENAEFFELTYEDPDLITLGRRFEAVASLLWLKAGGVGACIEKAEGDWLVPKDAIYGVLFTTDKWREFADAMNARADDVRHAYIVTDSNSAFQQIRSELPTNVVCTQLYSDYLRTFEINTKGRA